MPTSVAKTVASCQPAVSGVIAEKLTQQAGLSLGRGVSGSMPRENPVRKGQTASCAAAVPGYSFPSSSINARNCRHMSACVRPATLPT
jgi:hypothetical protein